MIKFEMHGNQLFRMLDKPVPLKEKNANVLVQFITHGIIGEYVMEHWLDCNQENVPIFVDSVDSDGDVTVCIENGNEHYCCPFPMFEIIGTLVKEGSKEWALYQMMQGKKVCNPTLAAEKSTRLGSYEVEQFNTYWYVVGEIVVEGKANYGALYVSSWISAAHPYGWQIYEPKPEPAKEPIANCDNCKHICTNSNIDHCQMYEPKSTFKVGDWVKYDIDSYLQVIEPSDKNRTLCRTLSGIMVYPYTSCLTKASPSEVIVHIGYQRGTVEPVSNNGIHLWFHLVGINRKTIATIRIESLDTRTRELVESLLEAMQED